ncbi:hypothetical protein AN218_14700 [Streptomyces nanshensis]|uniref:Uncharacterized protein n=2 Tax=Streptomyces nanshensis TaxID=518642 RepID=A0A1E7L4D1_9ACTN|nr:hypothetical protein AN218_14700 [Streptomyces nanshensis]
MYEKFIPDPADQMAGKTARLLPGTHDSGHWINRNFAPGTGLRLQPDRLQEADQLKHDELAVHERILDFGDAVLQLLTECRGHPETASAPGPPLRRRAAAYWIGREPDLLPPGPGWPRKLNPFQRITFIGLAALGVGLVWIPLTVMSKAALFDHAAVFLWATALVAAAVVAVIYRTAPRLMSLPGKTAAAPGIVAAIAAVAVWQLQGPVADHYFADPWQRYDQQFDQGCLAASPYRTANVESTVEGRALIIIPLSGERTLRLGPAENGGTQPLHALDHGSREVLRLYGC